MNSYSSSWLDRLKNILYGPTSLAVAYVVDLIVIWPFMWSLTGGGWLAAIAFTGFGYLLATYKLSAAVKNKLVSWALAATLSVVAGTSFFVSHAAPELIVADTPAIAEARRSLSIAEAEVEQNAQLKLEAIAANRLSLLRETLNPDGVGAAQRRSDAQAKLDQLIREQTAIPPGAIEVFARPWRLVTNAPSIGSVTLLGFGLGLTIFLESVIFGAVRPQRRKEEQEKPAEGRVTIAQSTVDEWTGSGISEEDESADVVSSTLSPPPSVEEVRAVLQRSTTALPVNTADQYAMAATQPDGSILTPSAMAIQFGMSLDQALRLHEEAFKDTKLYLRHGRYYEART